MNEYGGKKKKLENVIIGSCHLRNETKAISYVQHLAWRVIIFLIWKTWLLC